VGLESFRETSHSIFFGRDEAIAEVVHRLKAAPLVVVSGASGSGKSSLVLGGVLPELRSQDWACGLRIIPSFVPGAAVLEHLATSARHDSHASSAAIAADVEAFRRDAQHLYFLLGGAEAPPALIIIDQFEEVFTLSTEKDRQALVTNLAQFLLGGQKNRLILTIRAEFESLMKERLLPSFQCEQAWYSIPEMDYEGLHSAIVKPAETVNLHIKPRVVDHLVKRVIGQPAALPLLQFTLRSLWNVRDRNRITWEVYKEIGGDPLVVLADSAKAFLNRHKDPQTLDEIKRILLELVRVDQRLEAYRQPVAKSALLAGGKANTQNVLRLLETADFVRVTPDLDGKDAVVEVKHESLIRNWPELVDWIGERRDAFRRRLVLTDAAVRWEENGRRQDDLLTGSRLAEAIERADLSELEKEYVRASEAAADKARRELERTNRRLRWQRLALSTCLLFALGAIVLAVHRQRIVMQQQQEVRIAQTQERDAQSLYAQAIRKQDAPQAPPKAEHSPRIYIQIQGEQQPKRLQSIQEALRKNGFVVPPFELVNIGPRNNTEVRFFRSKESNEADRIVKILQAQRVPNVRPQYIPGYEKSKRIPSGQYEIWFAPGALQ
jgi:hypothetical protein